MAVFMVSALIVLLITSTLGLQGVGGIQCVMENVLTSGL